MPISVATELISTGKCIDMDCVLDLWLNTIYNDVPGAKQVFRQGHRCTPGRCLRPLD